MNNLRNKDLFIYAKCEILGEKASGMELGKIAVKNGKRSQTKQNSKS
jgi:hypothetical protein